MFVVKMQCSDQKDRLYFAGSKKELLPMMEQVMTDSEAGLSEAETVDRCSFVEINTRETRSGRIGEFLPLSRLVRVKLTLRSQTEDDES